MQFQIRDGEILQAIYDNEGVLAKRQLKKLFWPDKSWRAMEQRLAKLYHFEFLNWPDKDQYKLYPIPEPVCWLGWRGALFVAGARGVTVEEPKGNNEYQLRKLQKELRKSGIRWVRWPRWSLLRHDLAVVDFRLAVKNSGHLLRSCSIERWLPESEFRSNMDIVSYKLRDKDGNVTNMHKGVCPDASFDVVYETNSTPEQLDKITYLLELDMSTHDNLRFGREKAIPGAAFINSPEFKSRFDHNIGYWLVVTNGGDIRMRNLIRQTREKVGDYAKLFYFTTIKLLETSNVLTAQIWFRGDQDNPMGLLNKGAKKEFLVSSEATNKNIVYRAEFAGNMAARMY